MNVKELIEKLSKLDPESEVIIQRDSEGNGYSPLYDVDGDAIYIPSNTWSGEVFFRKWTPEECCMDVDDHARLMEKKNCCVFAPVN